MKDEILSAIMGLYKNKLVGEITAHQGDDHKNIK